MFMIESGLTLLPFVRGLLLAENDRNQKQCLARLRLALAICRECHRSPTYWMRSTTAALGRRFSVPYRLHHAQGQSMLPHGTPRRLPELLLHRNIVDIRRLPLRQARLLCLPSGRGTIADRKPAPRRLTAPATRRVGWR